MFRTPGAPAFCAAALVARAGGAMMGVGIVLMVSALYGSYGWAGALTAANGLAWAAGNAVLSRLVDRHGQAQVMVPSSIVSALGLASLVVAAMMGAPVWVLFPPAAIAGFCGGSAGAMVRARWNHALDDPAKLHTAFSLESTLDEITYILGPVVATALSTMVHPAAGLVAPIVLGLGGGMWFYYGLRRTQPPAGADAGRPSPGAPGTPGSPTDDVTSNRFVLAFAGMVPVVGVTALFGISFGAIDVAAVAAATTWGVRPLAGLVLAVFSFGSGVAGLAYGARQWASPLPRRFLVGVAAFALLAMLFLTAHNVVVLTLCGFLIGMAVAPTETNANSLVTVLVPKRRLTEGLAWVGTSIGIGASLGSSLAGRLIDVHGYMGGYWTVVVCAMAGAVVAVAGARSVGRAA